LLQGESLPNRPLYWHYPHYGNQGGEPSSIIRSGDWKLIHYWEDGRHELYDLSVDVSERTDLSARYPALADSLHTELGRWLAQTGARMPEKDPLFRADSLQLVLEGYQSGTRLYWEEQRRQMLDSAWAPNADWWGSE
jgi:hypothetical protein